MGSVVLTNNHYHNMKFVIVALLFAAVAADQAYPKPAYPAAYPKSYDYPYNNFGHKESSDGKVVSGSYNVALPDGRIQTVTYTADDYNGYVAKVTYTGEAKYPAYKAAAYPAPAYPTPAYPKKY